MKKRLNRNLLNKKKLLKNKNPTKKNKNKWKNKGHWKKEKYWEKKKSRKHVDNKTNFLQKTNLWNKKCWKIGKQNLFLKSTVKNQVKQKKGPSETEKAHWNQSFFLRKEKAFFWQEEQRPQKKNKEPIVAKKEKPVVEKKNIEKENLLKNCKKKGKPIEKEKLVEKETCWKNDWKILHNKLSNKLLQERWVDAQGWARRRTSRKEERCEFAALGVPRVEQTRDMVAQRMVDASRWRFQFRFADTEN